MTLSAVHSAPPRQLAAISLSGFLLLGLLASVLGPALPRLSERYGLSATDSAWLLSLNSAGAFLGVVLAGLLSARLTAQHTSLIAAVLLGLGSLGLAFAPSYLLALIAALILGLGFGILDLSLNVWVSMGYGERSASMLNLLSASFGVGAVLAPLAVGLSGGLIVWPLLGCAALALMLVALLLRLPPTVQPATQPKAPPIAGARPRLVSSRLLVVFVLFFLAYVAAEGGVAAWEVTHLLGVLEITAGAAAQFSSLFWVAFTLGRLLSARLALRFAPEALITVSLTLAALSLALASVPAAAVLAYALTGLFLAPVFTTGLVWFSRVLPGSRGPTFVFAGAFLGPVMFSPIVGAMRDKVGPEGIPLALTAICLLTLGLVVLLRSWLGGGERQVA